MIKRALWVCGLCGALSGSCSNASTGSPTGAGAGNLLGTWNLTTTATGGALTTVTVGQDSLTITSPDFTLTATRTGNTLAFTDEDSPGDPSQNAVLTATQTAGTFNAGLVPFDLSGSWTMQAGPTGGSPAVTCTLAVSATEIDGSCQQASPTGPWFSFTTTKTSTAASGFGDFGGMWNNIWTWPGTNGGTFPCTLDFTGNSITTCAGGPMNGGVTGSPLAGITFTYDGANTVSGAAQGWAEYSATR